GGRFGGGEEGGYIVREFMAAFDGLMSLVKLLELLSKVGVSLTEVIDRLPPAHLATLEVPVPWEAKGTVMRRLLERMEGQQVLTIDGVKTFRGDDWALVVPHPLEPVVRVWAEAGTA